MGRLQKKLSKLGWLGMLGVASGLGSVLGLAQGCYADYGPMPAPDYACTADDECTQRLGADWYCDEASGGCLKNTGSPDAGPSDAGN